MPRKPRFFLPGVPAHIVQRGNNRQPIFFDDCDYRAYLHWLKEAAERWSCRIQAYVLMTNHVHLLLTPDDTQGTPRGNDRFRQPIAVTLGKCAWRTRRGRPQKPGEETRETPDAPGQQQLEGL